MQSLLAGYRRFREKEWPGQRKRFESLVDNGQKPETLVITCVDSRLDPAMIFDAGPGDMLTIRNVASLVPPYEPDTAYHGTSAALEFGVRVLEIPHIVVMGHSGCGGVKALLGGGNAGEFISPWMSIAGSARERALQAESDRHQRVCEHETVKVSLANLATFPWIAERLQSGKIRLHGAWFDLRNGALSVLQPDGNFAVFG